MGNGRSEYTLVCIENMKYSIFNMKQKAMWFCFLVSALIVTSGSGCRTASTPTSLSAGTSGPVVSSVAQVNATPTSKPEFRPMDVLPIGIQGYSVNIFDVDADGQSEYGLLYQNTDTLEGSNVVRQHLEVWKLSGENYVKVFEDIVPNESYQHYPEWQPGQEYVRPEGIAADRIEQVSRVTVDGFPGDLLFEKKANEYEIIGFSDGTVKKISFRRGTDVIESTMVDAYTRILEVTGSNGKIIEKWGGTCEGNEMCPSGTTPCYTFNFEISYSSKKHQWEISRALNIQKDRVQWAAYEKRFPDAKPFSGVLPF
jgi:hypothetical protein